MSARVWRLLMHLAWRLHSLVCRFFGFSLVCWGFVQGYLHRGCLCKREIRKEAELVERVEVAGALSIPVFGDILSGMFLVAGAVQPSVRSQATASVFLVSQHSYSVPLPLFQKHVIVLRKRVPPKPRVYVRSYIWRSIQRRLVLWSL